MRKPQPSESSSGRLNTVNPLFFIERDCFGNYKAPCLSLGGNAWWTPSGAKAHAAARSYHTGGVNAAMSDGSVRFAANTIDQATWRALATRAGGEVVDNSQ
jgi:prepilin-type processing-associated H-X9-DG protein